MTEPQTAAFAQLVPMSYDQLVQRLKQTLSTHRYQHCRRVEQTAIDMAKRFHADPLRAGLAGMLHDYAKEKSDADFKRMIQIQKLDPQLLAYGNAIWHGVVGQYFVKQELGIKDPQILQAIAHHTVGDPKMTTLDKIIFVADYVEPGRHFPGVDQARQALAAGLDQAVAYELQHTILYLAEQRQKIYPTSVATYNVWGVQKEHEHE